MDSFPSFHPKINKNVLSKDKKIKNSSKLFRSSLDISGINDNQSELFIQSSIRENKIWSASTEANSRRDKEYGQHNNNLHRYAGNVRAKSKND